VLQALIIVEAIIISLLWDFFALPPAVAFILVAVACLLPYNLSCYDFYVFTMSVDKRNYGFAYGIFGFMDRLLYLIPGCIMLSPIPFNDVLIVCLILLVVSVFLKNFMIAIDKLKISSIHAMFFVFKHSFFLL